MSIHEFYIYLYVIMQESQYQTCLDILDQSRQRVKNQASRQRPTSPATLKLFKAPESNLVKKLQRRVQGGAPGSAPALIQVYMCLGNNLQSLNSSLSLYFNF